MSKKLFVGSLPWAVNDEALKEAFATYGNVISANVVTDRQTGRSRGFGFVEFENDSEATAAIEALNGSELDGRNIVVNEAKPKN
ncbi:MAG: RNA-binding protein [Ignavibacteria bacterium]|nr:RNA-binding protein [Bacteroidota bacterium]MCZ6703572.1 RNA-binding protein [Ignavibacteria bacterium]